MGHFSVEIYYLTGSTLNGNQQPLVSRWRSGVPDLGGEMRTKPRNPAADRLVRNNDTACGQQIFDIPQTQCEAMVGPDRVGDHRAGKAKALQTGEIRNVQHANDVAATPIPSNLTMPQEARDRWWRVADRSGRHGLCAARRSVLFDRARPRSEKTERY